MNVSIVIPTYNERDNIPDLFDRLDDVTAAEEYDIEVLVIDDDSHDGTAKEAVLRGAEVDYRVRVIIRTSDPDLSRSVVRGFREARGDVVVVMDADLQHPPTVVPDLVSEIGPDVPMAIGTRYANGGRIENWPLFRRVVSYGALALAKLFIPPARGVSDPISGFFAVRSDVVCPAHLAPDGYKILLEFLVSIDPYYVGEVGFVFANRERGETSLDPEQYYRFLRHLIRAGISYRLSRTER